MNKNLQLLPWISWLFAFALIVIGILNLVLIHPVPGFAYLFISLLYLPPVNIYIKEKTGLGIHPIIKIILGIILIMFTLGVSDLAEMYHI